MDSNPKPRRRKSRSDLVQLGYLPSTRRIRAEAFAYDPTSINKKLWVNATMGKGKPPFAPPCGMPLSISENRIAVPYLAHHLVRKRRGPIGTAKIKEIDAASPRRCILEGCIPKEVQTQQPESRQNAERRIPALYVPLQLCVGPPIVEMCRIVSNNVEQGNWVVENR